MKKIILILISVSILILFNVSIYQKEQVRLYGENVFLELKPVDPRSLIQGDYMRLGYNLQMEENQLKNQTGYIVISVTKNKIGKFKRFYNKGEQLASDEKILKYRNNSIEPNSFMFQEGHDKIYQKAK